MPRTTAPPKSATTASGVGIRIDNVEKVFAPSTPKEFRALEPVCLDIDPGEFVSVVGPSGCGKSTLMLMVAGLLSPSAGSISVDGKRLSGPLTEVGIAFQDHLLLDFRTAEDNVLLQGIVRKRDMRPIKARAAELFHSLGLDNARHKYPNQLSGGMRQRVSLARTLVHDPPLLMMDEPFGALDALTRLQVRKDLEELWMGRRPTVLFITHSVEEAVGLSDRVIVMGPSPGTIVDEIAIDLPRPRPLALGDSPEFGVYTARIYDHFERLGVLH
ncbi:ABC transporter ATP-binding protein [Mycobacterium sp. 21AC1]|uniref:ABC transporter ATP-binding protein n=1 Tax=[Mycobacterium] appelbergii TaxID=2939269 RepID=UPI0029392AB9|nr:ABC transporter ATP-binding protein [Mycobacterium sp. 21AC1]MDV3125464.1 ABC transporter ATP-binding protein [Mycobacterium sp. 21AC1]